MFFSFSSFDFMNVSLSFLSILPTFLNLSCISLVNSALLGSSLLYQKCFFTSCSFILFLGSGCNSC
jgi:hypothetical protein